MRIVTSPDYVRIASISVTPLRTACNITFREAQLEAADGAVIAEIVAGLGRIIAGEDDCHSVIAAGDRLRIVNPPAEKVGAVPAGRSDQRRLWEGLSASASA